MNAPTPEELACEFLTWLERVYATPCFSVTARRLRKWARKRYGRLAGQLVGELRGEPGKRFWRALEDEASRRGYAVVHLRRDGRAPRRLLLVQPEKYAENIEKEKVLLSPIPAV